MSIPSGSEHQAAALAVSRFGADPTRTERIVEEIAEQRARGTNADLLDVLVKRAVLTDSQAENLRRELNDSPSSAASATPTEQIAASPSYATPLPDGARALSPSASGQYLKSIGSYRLLRRLGQGGMGSVYLGYEEGPKRQVAIKVLSEQLASNQAYVERFYREAKSGGQLDHPNIVRFIAAGQDKATSKHFLVMEFVDGESAHALLERAGRLSVSDAVHITLDIARGLEHAHSRNIIHRDIKPDNILISKSGIAKLADLGLAKRLDDVSNLTGLRVGFGTVDYIPYEQSMSAKHADARSDIYALGATLYHLVTGQVPFPANNYLEIAEKKQKGILEMPSAVNAKVPPVLDRILQKMLARKPADRYQMVSELIVELERTNLAEGIPSFADPDKIWEDPLVRARLASPAPPTQLDMQSGPKGPLQISENGSSDFWVLRFRNKEGQPTKRKMSTRQILDGIRDGRIGTQVEAARNPRGEFYPLTTFPEFRDATAARERAHDKSALDAFPTERSLEPVAVSYPWWLIGTGICVAAIASGIIVYMLLMS